MQKINFAHYYRHDSPGGWGTHSQKLPLSIKIYNKNFLLELQNGRYLHCQYTILYTVYYTIYVLYCIQNFLFDICWREMLKSVRAGPMQAHGEVVMMGVVGPLLITACHRPPPSQGSGEVGMSWKMWVKMHMTDQWQARGNNLHTLCTFHSLSFILFNFECNFPVVQVDHTVLSLTQG